MLPVTSKFTPLVHIRLHSDMADILEFHTTLPVICARCATFIQGTLGVAFEVINTPQRGECQYKHHDAGAKN